MDITSLFQFGVPTGILVFLMIVVWRTVPPYLERQAQREEQRDRERERREADRDRALVEQIHNVGVKVEAFHDAMSDHERQDADRYNGMQREFREQTGVLVDKMGALTDRVVKELRREITGADDPTPVPVSDDERTTRPLAVKKG